MWQPDERPPVHVLVVDDSAVVRQVLQVILGERAGMRVTVAADPVIAMAKMRLARPDVILLDLEMPRMDGMSFLRKLMAEDPIPVVICSGFAASGTAAALHAMDEGAVAIVPKPRLGIQGFLRESALMLEETVRGAAAATVRRRHPVASSRVPSVAPWPLATARALAGHDRKKAVVVMGASVGGTEALRLILQDMPRDCLPLVIVQHMPEGFTRAFAERLDHECQIEVKEAQDGDAVRPGRALVAPGNHHTAVVRRGCELFVRVSDGPLVSRHRPSVDVLFRSAALLGPEALGVILTGMGTDGALGLLEMKRAGAHTIAQDKDTCVVFGMPKDAIARGAVDQVAALPRIAALIAAHASGRGAPQTNG